MDAGQDRGVERRPYERPELERFGNFDDLTKASTGHQKFDFNFQAGQPIPPNFGGDNFS